MSGLSSSLLHLYEAPAPGPGEVHVLDAPSDVPKEESERAEWLACRETWRPFPGRRPTSRYEPYSLAWFEEIERRRYSRHGHWIPKLFEFNRHRGEQVLCLGEGLGTDWVQYALGGAVVHYCSPTMEPIALAQRNFQLRGLKGQFHRGFHYALPIASDSMDIVCMSGMANTLDPLEPVAAEIFRVLKPGGKIIAALPAMYDSHYWQAFWFPWVRLNAKQKAERSLLSTARKLKTLFGRFSEPRIRKRHLRRSDIPHIWRWMLLPILERMMGRYLVLKSFKPLGASLPMSMAA
jgi:SAM-dependent methyltransferase